MTHSVKSLIQSVGTIRQVADLLGVSRQTVHRWIRRNRISPDYVIPFCQITGARPETVNEFAERLACFSYSKKSRRKPKDVTTI